MKGLMGDKAACISLLMPCLALEHWTLPLPKLELKT